MTTALEVQRMLGDELDTMMMADIHPELQFVWDLIDKLRDEIEPLAAELKARRDVDGPY